MHSSLYSLAAVSSTDSSYNQYGDLFIGIPVFIAVWFVFLWLLRDAGKFRTSAFKQQDYNARPESERDGSHAPLNRWWTVVLLICLGIAIRLAGHESSPNSYQFEWLKAIWSHFWVLLAELSHWHWLGYAMSTKLGFILCQWGWVMLAIPFGWGQGRRVVKWKKLLSRVLTLWASVDITVFLSAMFHGRGWLNVLLVAMIVWGILYVNGIFTLVRHPTANRHKQRRHLTYSSGHGH